MVHAFVIGILLGSIISLYAPQKNDFIVSAKPRRMSRSQCYEQLVDGIAAYDTLLQRILHLHADVVRWQVRRHDKKNIVTLADAVADMSTYLSAVKQWLLLLEKDGNAANDHGVPTSGTRSCALTEQHSILTHTAEVMDVVADLLAINRRLLTMILVQDGSCSLTRAPVSVLTPLASLLTDIYIQQNKLVTRIADLIRS